MGYDPQTLKFRAPVCPCACGADLGDAPEGPVWTFLGARLRAEFRKCPRCHSSRAFIPPLAGPVIVGHVAFPSLLAALEHPPERTGATIRRGGEVLARAVSGKGKRAPIWEVARPSR